MVGIPSPSAHYMLLGALSSLVMQLYGPRFMSQLWADPESGHWQGKQLGEPSLNLAIRGRAGAGIGQQCPHGSPPPLPELQQSGFPEYPSLGIRLHSSDPIQGRSPCFPVSHHVLPSMGCLTICRVSTASFCPYDIPGKQTIIPPISWVRTLRSQAATRAHSSLVSLREGVRSSEWA